MRIPLFPLQLVLLPGRKLPLHIFEPRYKLMIRQAVHNSEPFGIVLAQQDGIATIGCTAVVVQVTKTYEDGRMDIMTSGQAAYRIQEIHDDKPYLEATVELLADDPQPTPASTTDKLRELFTKCHLLLRGSLPPRTDDAPPASLAYRLAGELPLDLGLLQELLEIRVESERQSRLLQGLNELLPQLAKVQQMRSKAAGNGHSLN